MDVHTPDIRSKNMRSIRSMNTKPELLIRQLLHRNGYRFRLSPKYVCGRPDLWLKKWNTAIFVHGCFWHLHDCLSFRWPKTNETFWKNKLTKNKERDKKTTEKLLREGKRVLIIWECAVKGRQNLPQDLLKLLIITWLKSGVQYAELTPEGLSSQIFDSQ